MRAKRRSDDFNRVVALGVRPYGVGGWNRFDDGAGYDDPPGPCRDGEIDPLSDEPFELADRRSAVAGPLLLLRLGVLPTGAPSGTPLARFRPREGPGSMTTSATLLTRLMPRLKTTSS